MNHRLGRLLRPSVGVYFVVMAVFCAVTLLAGEYWLAAGEAAITLAAFGVYVMNRKRRERQIQKYLRSAPNTLESLGQGESPFPAVVVRLADGKVKIGIFT